MISLDDDNSSNEGSSTTDGAESVISVEIQMDPLVHTSEPIASSAQESKEVLQVVQKGSVSPCKANNLSDGNKKEENMEVECVSSSTAVPSTTEWNAHVSTSISD